LASFKHKNKDATFYSNIRMLMFYMNAQKEATSDLQLMLFIVSVTSLVTLKLLAARRGIEPN
jgi:hypothetical protein